MKQKVLFIISISAGLLIAYIDSHPTWDDTGITVLALVAGGGIIGFLLEKRPWLYALAFGLWIPAWELIIRQDLRMLIVLIFPFVGVYTGWAIRKLSEKALRPS